MSSELCFFDAYDDLAGYGATVRDCAETLILENGCVALASIWKTCCNCATTRLKYLTLYFAMRTDLILNDLGHAAWANTPALTAAGYAKAAHKPDGNIILCSFFGEPNGVVLEIAPNTMRTMAFPPPRKIFNLPMIAC